MPPESARKRTSRRPTSLAILLAILVFALYILQQQGVLDLGLFPSETPSPSPAAGGGGEGKWYEIYFTTPRYPDKQEYHRGGIDEKLIAAIEKAKRSIDIAAYEFDLENVAQALSRAKERGVKVRMVTDTDNLDLPAVQMLSQAGIHVAQDKRQPIMHNKFVVIDGETVWTGSWNLTVNCTYRNNNNAIAIRSPALAENYTTEFEEMFAKGAFGPNSPARTPHPKLTIDGTQVENYFAPEDKVGEKVIAQVRQAQKSIRFLAFSFTHDGIGQALMEKFKAGMKVQGVFEKRQADEKYSEFGPMRDMGMDVLTDGNPYIMHHKVFIIDDQTVILGSFNFSRNADESNDENVLIIRNSDVAAAYQAEFERVYQQVGK